MENYRKTVWNSFYVSGDAESVAGKLKSRLTDANDRAAVRPVDLSDLTVDDERVALRVDDIRTLLAVEVSPMRDYDFKAVLRYGPLLRALVVGYKSAEGVSEVIPCDYELAEPVSESNDCLGFHVLESV